MNPSMAYIILLLLIAGLVILGLIWGAIYLISKIKRQTIRLEKNQQYYQSLYYHNPDTVLTIDSDGRFVSINKQVALYGYEDKDLLNQSFLPYIVSSAREHTMNCFKRAVNGESITFETMVYGKKGDLYDISVTNIPIKIKDEIVGVYGILKDITAQKRAEETIEQIDFQDNLTELPSRYHFSRLMESVLSKDRSNGVALLFIDLDDFQLINETMGQEISNDLLKAVSQRLRECVRGYGDAGRNYGDEFLVLLPDLCQEKAETVAENIIKAFNASFQIRQYELYITVSIGISFFPEDTRNPADLIKKAESAMQQAKKNGKNSFQFYSQNLTETRYERLELETDLRRASERNEFELYYQPKVNLNSGKINGVEALIRWQHPEKGFISPATFIPVAEDIGLIIPIGEWVLETACRQAKNWESLGLAPLIMAVNLSVRQLYQPNIVETVQRILEETDMDPAYLELEITESMMVDSEHAHKILHELRNLGVKISLDDFGTGFSSLHYLKDAPFHKLKIDQSFIRHCTEDTNDATIVKTIIAMSHQLKLEVIAEGVETKEHLIFLQQNLCDVAQGFLFCRPVPPDEFVRVIGHVERIVSLHGLPQDKKNKKWLEQALEVARQELLDTIRLQQGMIFKFKKIEDKYIHTLCDGDLLYRLGLTPEQIIGHELGDFQSADEAARKRYHYNLAWEGKRNTEYEAEMNGVFYIASLRPIIKGGEVVEVIASCVDITERKRIEEALRRSEFHNRLIAENTSDLIVILDENYQIQYASPSHNWKLALSPEDMKYRQIFEFISNEDNAEVKTKLHQMETEKIPVQLEFQHTSDCGQTTYFEVQWIPIFNEEDNLEQIVVASRDITERKKTEEYIRKNEKISVVGQLAAGVAHEIRNPLTAIKGYLQLLRKEEVKPKLTDVVLEETGRIEDIISEFLSLSNSQKGDITQVDLTALIKKVIILFKAQATKKNIDWHEDYIHTVPLVECDEGLIKQVIINIFQNALDAIGDSGIVTVAVENNGTDSIRIRVKDNGTGIAEERLAKIGAPFYSTKEKGIGLGLTLSEKIVQDHGGTLDIESRVNEGTTVEIVLPVHYKNHILV